jgi:hypothetical protein
MLPPVVLVKVGGVLLGLLSGTTGLVTRRSGSGVVKDLSRGLAWMGTALVLSCAGWLFLSAGSLGRTIATAASIGCALVALWLLGRVHSPARVER